MKLKSCILAGMLLLSVFTGTLQTAAAANIDAYSDATDHWAYPYLSQAVDEGMLTGIGNTGLLSPDAPLSGAQMAAMLCKYLGAESESYAYPNADNHAWYYEYACQAETLEILPEDGTFSMTANVTRGQAFYALAHAFQLIHTDIDLTVLDSFPDIADAPASVQKAAAALLNCGALSDADTALSLNNSITRAEFTKLLYNIVSSKATVDSLPDTADKLVLVTDSAVSLENQEIPYSIMLAPSVHEVALQNTTISGDLIVRGADIPSLTLNNVMANTLMLAATDSPVFLLAEDGSYFDTIVVGDGSGDVTLSGSVCDTLEITGNHRNVVLSGMDLPNLKISGQDCTIYIDDTTQIQRIYGTNTANDNSITVNGTVGSIELNGSRITVDGNGFANDITCNGYRCNVTLASENTSMATDDGLNGIVMTFDAPTVQAGGQLKATASFSGVTEPKTCRAQWYLDGQAIPGYQNNQFVLSNDTVSSFAKDLTFTYNMQTQYTVGLAVFYDNPMTGQTEKIFEQASVPVENYPDAHYIGDILSIVTPTYKKGNTDYTDAQKVAFVNAKKYSSKTKYLIWVSLSAQKVNIFEGSQKNWSLLHSFDCASGASSSPTPLGVTHVTYKQTAWITNTYQCRPIVRFYPGTGYAFHSRLYSPNGKKLIDGTMGRPASHGCIRMMDEGIYWIYNNIPANTTVVIY